MQASRSGMIQSRTRCICPGYINTIYHWAS